MSGGKLFGICQQRCAQRLTPREVRHGKGAQQCIRAMYFDTHETCKAAVKLTAKQAQGGHRGQKIFCRQVTGCE